MPNLLSLGSKKLYTADKLTSSISKSITPIRSLDLSLNSINFVLTGDVSIIDMNSFSSISDIDPPECLSN